MSLTEFITSGTDAPTSWHHLAVPRSGSTKVNRLFDCAFAEVVEYDQGSHWANVLEYVPAGTNHVVFHIDLVPQNLAVAEWYRAAQDAIVATGQLEPDWNGYGAEPPSSLARVNTEKFLTALSSSVLTVASTRPTSDGIALSVRSEHHQADLEFTNYGSAGVLVRRHGVVSSGWDIEFGGDEGLGTSVSASVRRLVELLSNVE